MGAAVPASAYCRKPRRFDAWPLRRHWGRRPQAMTVAVVERQIAGDEGGVALVTLAIPTAVDRWARDKACRRSEELWVVFARVQSAFADLSRFPSITPFL